MDGKSLSGAIEKTVSFYVLPGVSQNIAFSVIKNGKTVYPQMLSAFKPSIQPQEIELPIKELYGSALDNNLHLAAPLEDGSYLLFHRCTVKSSLFNLDHMITKENKEFASSIATLDMEPGEPYPINLESDEAQ